MKFLLILLLLLAAVAAVYVEIHALRNANTFKDQLSIEWEALKARFKPKSK